MAKKASKAIEEAESEPGPTGYRGIGQHALSFLEALRENNDRAWFAANKSIYDEQLDAPFRELVRDLAARLDATGSEFAPNPKSPVYRIYRDVRFSKNKDPYKTHLGASLHRGGDKSSPGILYVHVQPAASFAAAGFYAPEAPLLRAIRQAIADDPSTFVDVTRDLQARGLAFGETDPLTRMPKGFEDHADSPAAEYLRYRSFIVARPIPDDDLERHDLAATIVEFAEVAHPLLEFVWTGTEGKPKPKARKKKA